MNKKKLTTGLAALALVGVVGVGGSLAWFTDSENKTNSFTTGKVNITLDEFGGADDVKTENGINYYNVLPGNTETKRVVVHNMENAAYVRVKLTVDGLSKEQVKELKFIDNENEQYLIRDNDFVEVSEDSCSFYLPVQEMKANDASGEYVALKEVVIPTTWGNEMVNKEFGIDVQAQAVQLENNEMGFRGLTDNDIVSVD